jgi:hypothetical protein
MLEVKPYTAYAMNQGLEADKSERRFPWAQVIGIGVVILAGLYASQHPHGFFAALLRVFLAP